MLWTPETALTKEPVKEAPMAKLIVAFLLFAIPIVSQEIPEAPKPKSNRGVFIVGTSLLAASKFADVQTTRNLLARGGYETNPTLGRHPSDQRLAGHAAAIFALQSSAFYLTERNRHAWVRWTGRIYLALTIEEHSRLAACNSGLNTHSVGAHGCHGYMPF